MKYITFIVLLYLFLQIQSRPVNCHNKVNTLELEVVSTQEDPCYDRTVCTQNCHDIIDCPSKKTLFIDLTQAIESAQFREVWLGACIQKWQNFDHYEDVFTQFYFKEISAFAGFPSYKDFLAKPPANIPQGSDKRTFYVQYLKDSVFSNVVKKNVVDAVDWYFKGLNQFKMICRQNSWQLNLQPKFDEFVAAAKKVATQGKKLDNCMSWTIIDNQIAHSYKCVEIFKGTPTEIEQSKRDFDVLVGKLSTTFVKTVEFDKVEQCKCSSLNQFYENKRTLVKCPTCYHKEMKDVQDKLNLVQHCRNLCGNPSAQSKLADIPQTGQNLPFNNIAQEGGAGANLANLLKSLVPDIPMSISIQKVPTPIPQLNIPNPIAQPIQPSIQPAQPIIQHPIVQPIVQPVAPPVIQPAVVQPVAPAVIQPIVQPIVEPIAQPVTKTEVPVAPKPEEQIQPQDPEEGSSEQPEDPQPNEGQNPEDNFFDQQGSEESNESNESTEEFE